MGYNTVVNKFLYKVELEFHLGRDRDESERYSGAEVYTWEEVLEIAEMQDVKNITYTKLYI